MKSQDLRSIGLGEVAGIAVLQLLVLHFTFGG